MKYIIFSIIGITFLTFSVSSCAKDENSPGTSETPVSPALKVFQDETWKVALYIDCNEDETYHFTAYTFSFDSSGTVTATNGSSSVKGSWGIRTNEEHNKFDLDFGKYDPLHKINDDWHIIEQTSSKIRLEDVGKKSGETEFLTFEKN
jgi:hypothetical protein